MTRRVARPRLALLMILTLLPSLTASGAITQEPPAVPSPAAPGGTPAQEAVATQPYVLSLRDAVKSALENNLDIVVRAYDPLRSEALAIAAESSFDPLLTGTASSSDTQRPTPTSFVQSSKSHEFNVAVDDPILTGGRYRIEVDALDNAANTLFNPSSNEWDTFWKVSLTQPLLRNFGVGASKTLIVEARNTLGISRSRFRQAVIETLSSAEKDYWDLNFALMNLKTSQAALQLAQDFLEQNRIKVRVGTLAPIEITQAEAQVADQEESVIIAESQVRTAEDVLRSVMNLPKDSPVWSQPIQPSDPLPLVEQSPEMDTAVSTALAHRPDLEQARLDLKNRETDLAWRRNQRRWGLDLQGSYGHLGFGRDVPLTTTKCNVSVVASDPPGQIFCLDDTTTTIGTLEHGSYGDSFDDLRRGANLDWRMTLTLGIPLGNRQAVANFTASEYALSQARKGLEALELLARVQVRDAVRSVQTTLKRVKAAQVNVRLQKEKLAAEQKKFENGMSTSFQVLQFQTDLFQAESRENLAMVDYNKAQVELERVQGTLLEARNVEMPSEAPLRTLPFRPRTRVPGATGEDARPAEATSTDDSGEAAPPAGRLPEQFVFDGRRLVGKGPSATP